LSKEEVLLSKKSSKRRRFQQVEIGKVDGKRAVVEAVPEAMSAFAGAPLIAAVEKEVGLLAELCKRIKDTRKRALVKHKAPDILLQSACQIGLGYPDGNDADWGRNEAGIMCALDRDPVSGQPGVSQETLCKFENKAVTEVNYEHIQSLFIDHFIRQHKNDLPKWGAYWSKRQRRKRITIDIDGTMIKTYGAQEGAIRRGGKYKHEMLYPSMIFIGDWLVAATLRMGCEAESETVIGQLEMVVPRLRAAWPGVAICVRLDAAFGSPALYSWCRKNHIDYLVGLRETSVLKLYAKAFMEAAEQEFLKEFGEPRFLGEEGKEQAYEEHARIRQIADKEKRMEAEKEWRQRRIRIVGEFSYKSEKWENWERILVRVDYTDRGFDVRYVMVSQQHGVPKQIYEDEYCQRGVMEQFIGRFKQTGHRLSSQTFYANQFHMTMYGVSYQLLVHLRERIGSKFERSDVETIRKTLLVMPVTFRRTKKKLILQISESHPHCRNYLEAWRRLSAA
jgi:hypothetical protein